MQKNTELFKIELGKLTYLVFLILHSTGGLLSSSEMVVLSKNLSPWATGLAGISNPAIFMIVGSKQSSKNRRHILEGERGSSSCSY